MATKVVNIVELEEQVKGYCSNAYHAGVQPDFWHSKEENTHTDFLEFFLDLPNSKRIIELLEKETIRGNRWWEREFDYTWSPRKKAWRLAMKLKYLISFAGGNAEVQYHEDFADYFDENYQMECTNCERIWKVIINY